MTTADEIGPRIRVVEHYDRRLPRIPAYPAELNQAWRNLIDNAVAAMNGAGTLRGESEPGDTRFQALLPTAERQQPS
ncbi:hypothetical protein ACWEGE_05635 [Amycolatopsis sp. NPDC004747]